MQEHFPMSDLYNSPRTEQPNSLHRILDALPRFYFPLLALLCLASCWRPLSAGDDVWAHAAIGRWIAEHHRVPHQTLFLWGAPPIEWVYHSWLSQFVFFQLLSRGPVFGPLLILLLTATVVILVFGMLWRAWLSRSRSTLSPPWLPPIFALAIFCSSLRFHPRPELFTALFLCVLLLFLSREAAGKSTLAQFLAIVLLFVLWANFHGVVAIGLLFLWAAALCDLVQDALQQRKVSTRARLHFLLAIVCSLAIFLNPYGFDYWSALKPVAGEAFSRIDEWKPFWKTPALNITFVVGEAVLVMLALCFWLGNESRRWSQLAWLVLMSAMFLAARRHLWLLPIVTLVVMASNARGLSTPMLQRFVSQQNSSSTRRLAGAAVATLLFLWILYAAPLIGNWSRLVSKEIPVKAANFLQLHYPGARVFNDYENSSYLQWRLAGRPPLFVDLLNAYPDQLLLDYLDTINLRAAGKKLLNERRIEVVILRKYEPDSRLAKLGKYLQQSGDWKRVYNAADGSIWVRRKGQSNPR
jgi:hypothetical protein